MNAQSTYLNLLGINIKLFPQFPISGYKIYNNRRQFLKDIFKNLSAYNNGILEIMFKKKLKV
jgi:hypothetical protein